MEKEEFEKRKRALRGQIELIQAEINFITREYIEHSLPLPVGTKVMIQRVGHNEKPIGVPLNAFVGGKKMYFGKPKYIFRKSKKDGSPSILFHPDYEEFLIID